MTYESIGLITLFLLSSLLVHLLVKNAYLRGRADGYESASKLLDTGLKSIFRE